MSSALRIIPDQVDCVDVELKTYLVWRYVKEDHRENDNAVSAVCFCLTERDGGHVSFSHSNKDNVNEMVAEIHRNIHVAKKTKPALYLSIDIKEAYEEINNPDELITFKGGGYPHIGMYYHDYSDVAKRNLIIASLVELSDLYFRAEGGGVSKVE
ncbi:hypothetical protein [Shigella sonnei]|uniref:hypothetical protein n=1 Tax=Shigella sonnei TaxID=624 RepID=UPI00117B5CF2|nr:hypothetical protein [Shigella sonnei]